MSTINPDDRSLVGALQPIIDRCADTHHWRIAPGQAHPSCVRRPARAGDYARHVDGGAAIGLCPILPGERWTRLAVLDLDSHRGECDWPTMQKHAADIMAALELFGLHAVPFRSRGGRGIHLYLLWQAPQDGYSVRETLRELLTGMGYKMKAGAGGVQAGFVEVFPKQDHVPVDGVGSMFLLPFAGSSCALHPVTLGDLPREWLSWPHSDAVGTRMRPERPTAPSAAPEGMDALREALAAIPNDGPGIEYDDWRDIVFGLHDATGGSADGLALAHEFSARSEKYDPDFLDQRVWPHIRSREGGITAGTIYKHARAAGWQPDDTDGFDEATGDEVRGDELKLQQRAPTGRFRVYSDDEITSRPPPRYRVNGWIQANGVGLIYGPSGVGKSFLALHLAAMIANGLPIGRYSSRQCEVAYVFAESAQSAGVRLSAWRQHHRTRPRLHVLEDAPRLSDKQDVLLLAEVLKARNVQMVVIDTLACAMGEAEETNEGFTQILDRCKLLARKLDGLVLLVHHSGKDESKGARGGSALRAGVDVEIEVQAADEGPRKGTWRVAAVSTKVRDTAHPPAVVFETRTVDLGMNEDLVPITSLVMEAVGEDSDAESRTSGGGRRNEFHAVDSVMLNVLSEHPGGMSEPELVSATSAQLPAGKRISKVAIRMRLKKMFDRGDATELDGRVIMSYEDKINAPAEQDLA